MYLQEKKNYNIFNSILISQQVQSNAHNLNLFSNLSCSIKMHTATFLSLVLFRILRIFWKEKQMKNIQTF